MTPVAQHIFVTGSQAHDTKMGINCSEHSWLRKACKHVPLRHVYEVQCGVGDAAWWRCWVVWVALAGGDSLCRGGADGVGACQPTWAGCALRTAPFRHCEYESCEASLSELLCLILLTPYSLSFCQRP